MLSKIEKILRSDMHLTMDLVGQMHSLNGSFDNLVLYSMEEFNDFMEYFTPIEIAEKIHFGKFNPNDSYFRFNAYANLESFKEWELEDEFNPYLDEIIEGAIEFYDELYIDDEILDGLLSLEFEE